MIRLAAALLLSITLHGQINVQGKVTNALDHRALGGVVVVLQGSADAWFAQTDGEGRFHAEAVLSGRYQVKAQREGFTFHPVRITIEAGAASPELDLRLLPLGGISGRVVDTDGDPVSRITVEAMRYTYGTGRKKLSPVARARTDDRGEYVLFGLAPGRYYVRASDAVRFSPFTNLKVIGPKPPTTYSTTWFPAAADEQSAVSLDLTAGAELRDTNLSVRPQRTYVVRVRLAGGSDSSAAPTLSIGSFTGMNMMVTSRYGNVFSYPGAAPGMYIIEGQDRTAGLSARRFVKVVDSDLDLTLNLVPALSLTGAVRVEGDRPVTLDSVRVLLEAEEPYNDVTVPVKKDGSFSVSKVQPVVYSIRVDTPAGTYLKGLEFGERPLAHPQIDMGHAAGPLTVTLGTDGGTINGDVDSGGAVVVLVPAWPEFARSASAGDGRFEFRDVAPGDYQLLAFDDPEIGAPLDPDFRKPFADRALSVHVAANSRQELHLKAIRP